MAPLLSSSSSSSSRLPALERFRPHNTLLRGPLLIVVAATALVWPYLSSMSVGTAGKLCLLLVGSALFLADTARSVPTALRRSVRTVTDRIVLDDLLRAVYDPEYGIIATVIGTFVGNAAMYALPMNERQRTELVQVTMGITYDQARILLREPGGITTLLPEDIQAWINDTAVHNDKSRRTVASSASSHEAGSVLRDTDSATENLDSKPVKNRMLLTPTSVASSTADATSLLKSDVDVNDDRDDIGRADHIHTAAAAAAAAAAKDTVGCLKKAGTGSVAGKGTEKGTTTTTPFDTSRTDGRSVTFGPIQEFSIDSAGSVNVEDGSDDGTDSLTDDSIDGQPDRVAAPEQADGTYVTHRQSTANKDKNEDKYHHATEPVEFVWCFVKQMIAEKTGRAAACIPERSLETVGMASAGALLMHFVLRRRKAMAILPTSAPGLFNLLLAGTALSSFSGILVKHLLQGSIHDQESLQIILSAIFGRILHRLKHTTTENRRKLQFALAMIVTGHFAAKKGKVASGMH